MGMSSTAKLGMAVGALALTILFLDTFGGYFLDGPLGPIPGGRMEGTVERNPNPDWSVAGDVIELEIRPEMPWSLSVWNVIDGGELYVPSAMGARRRWVKVALEDPRVRVRVDGKIYERRLVKVEDEALRTRLAKLLSERYGSGGDESTWFFHLTPR